MNITVFGAGYVGLSNAIMLAQTNKVELIDIDKEKISTIKNKKSPFKDSLIENYLKKSKLELSLDSKLGHSLKSTSAVIIATPTNFDDKSKNFETSSIEGILRELSLKKYSKLVIIRSTVPVGFTIMMQKKYPDMDISFFPEFLRENQALHDSFYPSRIICGSKSKRAKGFMQILKKAAMKKNIKTKITSPSEAEAIKLFSNAYLAMRISFFNELDSFAMSKNLDTKNIIDGVSSDPRVGNFYNNPSFGYGGYCLPKDTKQLSVSFKNVPQKLITATIQANVLRKKIISDYIKKTKKSKIGIYRLLMKSGSDNIRESSIIDVIKDLKKLKKEMLIFEPTLNKEIILGVKIEQDLEAFLNWSDLVVANRIDKKIENVEKLIFTRDLYRKN